MLGSQLKLAFKVLLRRKFFTFISLFGISFTLLVLMVVAAMLDHSFGPLPPEVHADRTLLVARAKMSGPNTTVQSNPGHRLVDRYVRDLPGVERVAVATQPHRIATYHDGRKEPLYLRRADGEWWRVLRFDFVEGAPYTSDDERDAARVAVINEATRERFFGSGPALGRSLPIDGQSFRVVGVVRNVPMSRPYSFADVWVPISTSRSDAYRQELLGDFLALVLAKSRADLPAIRAEFRERLRRAELPDPKTFDTLTAAAETLPEAVASEVFGASDAGVAKLVALMSGAALLFMLLPTVNLVNINVSRILERSSEIGVRKAFGASSGRLVGQFVVENVVLTMIGGVLGLALSAVALAILNRSGVIPYAQFGLNARVFGYGFLLALAFGLISGVYPAWRMSRLNPVDALGGRL